MGENTQWREEKDALDAAIKALELLDHVSNIAFWFGPNGGPGTSATISVRRSRGEFEYHVTGEFPGEAKSLLDAWEKVQEDLAR